MSNQLYQPNASNDFALLVVMTQTHSFFTFSCVTFVSFHFRITVYCHTIPYMLYYLIAKS